MKNKLKLTIALFGVAGLTANGSWTLTNALDVSEDLALVEAFDHFEGEVGDPGTLTLIEDPTGVLKNLDGTPAIVVEALGSQTEGAAFVQSYGFPGLADSVYTVYYRWMYPTGGGRSHQELATLSGQSEILVDGSLLKGNGPWYHNWSSLGFCYNGGGSWVCEPPLGAFLADTWYEYWMVIDPVNVSYDWYIRGGDFTDISVVYLDAIYANIDNVAPLKALQQVHYMGQGGLFGPQYYDAMYIDLTGENLVTPSDLGSIHGAAGGSNWTLANALDVSEDLALVDIFDSFTGDVGDPGTLTLIEDPTGVLKNLDGTPAIVVEALGSQTDGAAFVQSYNLPATPTDSIYTVYYRWMYPTGGTRSHQELATLSGESEILVDGSLIKGNGPWYHNWSDLNFCYNGGGSWVCGPALGGYLADTWYEYFMVIDPANISYDWYIRGGDFTDVTLIFENALYANIDSVAPLKAIQEVHYMGQGGVFGPQYYDAMYIDLTGENLDTPSDLGSILGGAVDPVAPKLVNISTRGRVGEGDSAMIGGFVIGGTENMDVLIQGVGLELDGQGGLTAAQLLADGTMSLVDGAGAVVAVNDDWETIDASENTDAAAKATAMDDAGSFVLASGSKSPAILRNLAPGLYTVILGGVNGAQGIALVEAYEVPE